MTIFNIIKMEYKSKKTILIVQILYNFLDSIRPFIYIYFPPIIIDLLINNQINSAYLLVVFFTLLSFFCDLFLRLLYIPFQVNAYILPHQFNKINLLHLLEIDYRYSQENKSINQYNNSINYSWQCSSIAYLFISIIVNSITNIVIITIIMANLDFYVLIFIAFIVFLNFILNTFKTKKLKRLGEIKNEIDRNIKYDFSVLLDLKYGKEIRMYPKLKELFLIKHDENIKKAEKHNNKVRKFTTSIDLLQNFILVFQNIVLYILIIYKYSKSLISLGAFFIYINTANKVYSTLNNITNVINEYASFKIFSQAFNDF